MSHNLNKIAAVFAVLVVIASGGYVVWRLAHLSHVPEIEAKTISIGVTPWPASASLYVASEKGYFHLEGLDATIRPYAAGHLALAGLLSGEVDLSTAADTPITKAALEGKPAAVIATLCEIDHPIKVVACKDRGISSPQDLRGKKIGVVEGTAAEFFLYTFRVAAFIKPEEMQVVNLEADKQVDALMDGVVDAVATWSPYTEELEERLGDNAVIFAEPSIYVMTWNMTTTSKYTTSHPETVKAVLRAIRQANRFLDENPAVARAISAKYIGTGRPLPEHEWNDYDFTLELNQSLILNMEDQARWMISANLTGEKRIPDFSGCLYPDGLESVAPETVNIIKRSKK